MLEPGGNLMEGIGSFWQSLANEGTGCGRGGHGMRTGWGWDADGSGILALTEF